MILIDTREKPTAIKGILKYFETHQIPYKIRKLDTGDYMNEDHPELIIDRKQTISELAKNVGSKDRERFKRELIRAQESGAHLIILVEQNRYQDRGEWVTVRAVSDLIRWSSPHTMVTGERVFRILASWTVKYPIVIEFCDRRSTGRRIAEILNVNRESESK